MRTYLFKIIQSIITLFRKVGQKSSFFSIFLFIMLYFIVLKLKLLNFSSHFKNIIHIRELESIFANMTHIRI